MGDRWRGMIAYDDTMQMRYLHVYNQIVILMV